MTYNHYNQLQEIHELSGVLMGLKRVADALKLPYNDVKFEQSYHMRQVSDAASK